MKAQTGRQDIRAVADELIIKYKDSAGFLKKRQFREEKNLQKASVRRDSLKTQNTEKVLLEEKATPETLEQIIETLKKDPNVEYAEPNYLMEVQSVTPNDPDYAKQWPLPQMNVPQAWELSTGDPETVIAVLDTGLDFSHPDAPQNLKLGYDFINDDNDPADDHGHGTFMAGVIAAPLNNSTGIAGICPNCSIMPVKVMDERGVGTYADVASGILYAADHGADIINLSIGGYGYSQTLLDAVKYAQEKGVLVIAAGGNQQTSDPLYPAAYSDVIGVSAADRNDILWSRSNTGDSIDIAAPGVDVYGLKLSAYQTQTGTSVASAHVSGVAAFFLSQNPLLSASSLTQRLYGQAVALPDTLRLSTGVPSEAIADSAEPEEEPETPDPGIIPGANADERGDSSDETTPRPREGVTLDYILGELYSFYAFSKNRMDDPVPSQQIQEFLNSQTGILKNYSEIPHGARSLHTAVEIISRFDSDNGAGNPGINQGILLVLLELKAKVITDPSVSKDTLQNIFGITQEMYKQYWKERVKICPDEVNEYGGACIYRRDAEKLFALDSNTLYSQLEYVTYERLSSPEDFKIFLKELAGSEEQFNHWWSFEDGSFFDLYNKWFGIPLWLMQAEEEPQVVEPPDNAFLKSPYEKNDRNNFCGIGSFFDHEYPIYTQEAAGISDATVLFTGKKLPSGIVGYSNYSGHNGIDSYPRNCVTRQGKEIYPAEDGEVSEVVENYGTEGYGNYVDIDHDIDNDGYPDYRTRYGHLVEKSSLTKGQNVTTEDLIGIAGNTGKSSGVHLHFHVTRLIKVNQNGEIRIDENKSKIIDPLGWWGDRDDILNDPWQQREPYAKSAFLFESGSEVDDKDHAFFEFNTQSLPWFFTYSDNDLEMKNGRALWRYTAHDPSHTWDNWAFWGADLDTAGKYQVKAFIPEYAVDGESVAGEKVTTKAIYRVYHNGTYNDITVDQKNNIGKWVNLGEPFDFEKGAKAAVRLIDEVADSAESGKVFWADAVKWELVQASPPDDDDDDNPPPPPPPPPPVPVYPDLTFSIDQDFQFLGLPGLLGYNYGISVKVQNIGNGLASGGKVCFYPSGARIPFCRGGTQIGTLGVGEKKEIRMFFSTLIPLEGDTLGSLVITQPGDSDTANNTFTVSVTALEDVGGVDLTFAELGGIKLDPASGRVQFVLRGENTAGQETIDLAGERSRMTKIFLQALAVPNEKHYIGLDIIGQSGKARVPSPFEQTDIAGAFLNADVAMKFDLFSFGDGYFNPVTRWTEIVENTSVYWRELQSQGFKIYPKWIIAATIIPGDISARQTGNTFFLENIALDINAGWWMREPSLDLTGFTISPEGYQEIQRALQIYKTEVENAVKKRAAEVTLLELNSATSGADPRWKELRSIYAAIAAAQWYKKQVKDNPNLPYADLVDSENLDGIGLKDPFDWGYWNSQAYQLFNTHSCMLLGGEVGTCQSQGGASLENSQPDIAGQLTTVQDAVLDVAIDQKGVIENNGRQYMFGATVETPRADLEVG
ncbi:MAG: S8 family serine peptidase, partial [Candidatus Peregrinibacteria bacterium]